MPKADLGRLGEQRGRLDGGGYSGNSLDGINGSSGREGEDHYRPNNAVQLGG
jgi:hypothetical protein